jgi:hypothetical protein
MDPFHWEILQVELDPKTKSGRLETRDVRRTTPCTQSNHTAAVAVNPSPPCSSDFGLQSLGGICSVRGMYPSMMGFTSVRTYVRTLPRIRFMRMMMYGDLASLRFASLRFASLLLFLLTRRAPPGWTTRCCTRRRAPQGIRRRRLRRRILCRAVPLQPFLRRSRALLPPAATRLRLGVQVGRRSAARLLRRPRESRAPSMSTQHHDSCLPLVGGGSIVRARASLLVLEQEPGSAEPKPPDRDGMGWDGGARERERALRNLVHECHVRRSVRRVLPSVHSLSKHDVMCDAPPSFNCNE